jgi:two-component system, NarL family, response regulator LiaR
VEKESGESMARTRRPIRVLICNKHTMFRDGIKALLAHGSAIKIVGEAATAKRAITLLQRLHPDIVLMDTDETDLTGAEATEKIRALDPHVQVLIVALEENERLVSRCLRAGAVGYVRKENRPPQLRHAIDTAFRCAPRTSSRPVDEKSR